MSKLTSHNVVVGLDLGDRYSWLCVLDAEGEVVEEARIPTTEASMRRWFEAQGPVRAALEVGTHSPWVSRLLDRLGHEGEVCRAQSASLQQRVFPPNRSRSDSRGAEASARPGPGDLGAGNARDPRL